MRAGGAEGDPERDGRRTLVNGWESRLWRLEDKHLREGSSVRQFGRPRPLRIRHRRRRPLSDLVNCMHLYKFLSARWSLFSNTVRRDRAIPANKATRYILFIIVTNC